MLLVQRNIYICALVVFVTLSLNAYILLFRRIYKIKDTFELSKSKEAGEMSATGRDAPVERAKVE